MIENFEQLLAAGKDSPLLRFSLGNAYLQAGDLAHAVLNLSQAVADDPGYSAAWKLLGKAYAAQDKIPLAVSSYQSGIAAATLKGDKQAAKEMTVFLKRLQK